jgi:hypothetical protein
LLCHGDLARSTPPVRAPLAADDPAAVAASLESKGGLPALVKAVLLRRALGHVDLASADIERFLSTIAQLGTAASARPEDAAAIEEFLDDTLDEAAWPEPVVWQALMRRLVAELPGNPITALRFRAEVALAAHLWRHSCPISGDDGACIQRVDASRPCRDAQETAASSLRRLHPGRYLQISCTVPHFAYRVYPRKTHLANEAQQLLTGALRRLDSAQLRPQRPGDPLDEAIAHAYFLRAEPQFEGSLAWQRWQGAPATLDPEPLDINVYRATPQAIKRHRIWHFRRMIDSEHVRPQRAYEYVLAHGSTRWAVAAQSRLAQLFFDYADQMTGCPRPVVMPAEYNGERRYGRCCCYIDDGPPIVQAQKRLAACVQEGNLSDDPYVAFCHAALEKLSPYEWPHANEIGPMPIELSVQGTFVAPPVVLN